MKSKLYRQDFVKLRKMFETASNTQLKRINKMAQKELRLSNTAKKEGFER